MQLAFWSWIKAEIELEQELMDYRTQLRDKEGNLPAPEALPPEIKAKFAKQIERGSNAVRLSYKINGGNISAGYSSGPYRELESYYFADVDKTVLEKKNKVLSNHRKMHIEDKLPQDKILVRLTFFADQIRQGLIDFGEIESLNWNTKQAADPQASRRSLKALKTYLRGLSTKKVYPVISNDKKRQSREIPFEALKADGVKIKTKTFYPYQFRVDKEIMTYFKSLPASSSTNRAGEPGRSFYTISHSALVEDFFLNKYPPIVKKFEAELAEIKRAEQEILLAPILIDFLIEETLFKFEPLPQVND